MKKILKKVNKKIIFILILIIGVISLGSYSTVYYSKFPLPTVKQLREQDITDIFNKHFSKENIIHIKPLPSPVNWRDIIGSESTEMKNFYQELREKVYIYYDNIHINYLDEPILNTKNKTVKINFLMNIKNNIINKQWKYNDILNYKITLDLK